MSLRTAIHSYSYSFYASRNILLVHKLKEQFFKLKEQSTTSSFSPWAAGQIDYKCRDTMHESLAATAIFTTGVPCPKQAVGD
jgi:hypothetical protein